jgi:hypothetical protein
MEDTVKIRYNHDAGEGPLKWRIVINNIEHTAEGIHILVPSYTTIDFIEGVGNKYHISCTPELIIWDGSSVTLKNITNNYESIK